MVQKLLFLLLFSGFLISSCSVDKNEYPIRENLSSGWEFSEFRRNQWNSAVVPGCVHNDLFINQLIDHPYFGDNELGLQWISYRSWEYRKTFSLSQRALRKNIEIVFDGLDTHAEVYLNDRLILKADNMFRSWRVPVNEYVKQGDNVLQIVFCPALVYDSLKALSSKYKLPDHRGFSRKSPYHYGWDWGPRLIGCGIWKPVYLEIYDDWRLEDVRIQSEILKSGEAIVTFDISISADNESEVTIDLNIPDENRHLKSKFLLKKGSNLQKLELTISEPKLWWPNGMGAPDLYQAEIIVSNRNNKQLKSFDFGINDIRLVSEPDSIGKSFFFKVNGKPVFIKGANYIPSDFFMYDKDKIRNNLISAKLAGMNMLRVWGGGYYEHDYFYHLADSLGIMIWQDFMFACNMYPGDDDFLYNVQQEASENVIRLRNHPCIALWCGNNEVDEGWKNWGWQKQLNYTEVQELYIEKAYDTIFNNILPSIIALNDSKRSYWPSSPSIGWGHDESMKSGDSHYWGVWWGEQAFEVYNQKVGRFMSEYGFQGFPSYRFLKTFGDTSSIDFNSRSFRNHQKHPRGFELIKTYMSRDFMVPSANPDYAFISGILQAEGMRIAIEAHRRASPLCMGTLYWQLNDCWPVISWSSIDYSGNWKPFHYQAKRSFKPVLLSVENPYSRPVVYLIREDSTQLKANLELTLMDFSGNTIKTHIISVSHSGLGSEKITDNLFHYFGDQINKSQSVIKLVLKDGNKVLFKSVLFLAKPRDLRLSKDNINYAYELTDDSCVIRLSSKKIHRFVEISFNSSAVIFSDNYFDLLPGEPRRISFARKGYSMDKLKSEIRIQSLNYL